MTANAPAGTAFLTESSAQTLFGGNEINVATRYGTTAAAINQAIVDANALSSAAFGYRTSVFLDARTWNLEAPVVPANYVTLRGAGRGKTILMPTGLNPAVKRIGTNGSKLTNFTLSDLTIDGANQAGTYTYEAKGVYIMYTSGCDFRRLLIKNTYATALGLDYPADNTVVDSNTYINAGRGLVVGGGGGNGLGTLINDEDVNSFVVTNNAAYGCACFGFLIEGYPGGTPKAATGTRVIGNYATGCGSAASGGGFGEAGTTGSIWEGNIAYLNNADGFIIGQGDGNTYPAGARVIMRGNVSMQNTGWGFRYDLMVTAAKGSVCTISGNTVWNNAAGGICGLLSSVGDAKRLAITDNDVILNTPGGAAILLKTTGTSQFADLTVQNNRVLDNGTIGIQIDANVSGGLVSGNLVADSGGGTQTKSLQVASGRTLTNVTFTDNDLSRATTPVTLTGATLTSCNVGFNPGWTRKAGVPTVTAPKGTVYQRTDGSAGSLLYVNTDGGTTWNAYA